MQLNYRLLFAAVTAAVVAACTEPAEETAIPRDPKIESRVDEILKGMTLEEKVGQCHQEY